MRPLKLTMQAFGTYLEKTEINMQRLGRNGLFLITGDTGSGKTTIFDAIMFALYGETSGGGKNSTGRNGEMLRSDFADSKIQTYVELEFENDGSTYKIWRSPAYERPEYKSKKQADVKWWENGVETQLKAADIDGKGDVKGRIREILGLTAEQFRQVAMIAQGEFRKLLVADTKTRGEIFKTIFDTRIYEFIQNKINEDYKAAEYEYERLKENIEEHINSIVIPDALFAEEINGKEESYILEKLKRLNKSDKKAYDVSGEKLEKLEHKINEFNNILNGLKKCENTIKELYDEYISEREQLDELNIKFTDINENYHKVCNISTDGLAADISRLEREIAVCSDCYELKKQVEKDSGLLEEQQKILTDYDVAIKELTGELDKIKILLDKGDVSGANVEKAKNELDKLKLKEKMLIDLKNEINGEGGINELEIKLAELEKEQAEAFCMRKEANEAYEQLIIIQDNEICGRLAERLTPEEPCPVCGSMSHPSPAEVTETTVTQEQIKNSRNAYENADREFQLKNTAYIKEKEIINIKKRTLVERINEFTCCNSYADAGCMIDKEMETAGGDIRQQNVRLTEYTRLHDEYEQAKIRRENILKEQGELESRKLEHEKSIFRIREMIQMNTGRLHELEKNITDSSDLLKQRLCDMKNSLEDINKRKLEAQKDYNKICEDRVHLNTSIRKIKEQYIRGIMDINSENINIYNNFDVILECDEEEFSNLHANILNDVCNVWQQLHGDINRLREGRQQEMEYRDEINKRYIFNEKICMQLEEALPKYELARKEYARMADLYKVSYGSYKFETYIQEIYFDKIIASANKRLSFMIHNQFELIRGKRTAGVRGLDLFVYDYRTGKIRDVKTLSGGEAFITSLAMALGLADVVQSNTSGVKIETLFIDEGFGSLDSDIMEQAIHVLAELSRSNHLVGIISHVAELQKRVERQICVTKDVNGISHIRML